MLDPEVREGLVAVREMMADPDRVVLTADHLWEDEAGNSAYFAFPSNGEASRGCMIAWVGEFLGHSGSDSPFDQAMAALRLAATNIGITRAPSHDVFTEAVREGRYLEVLDKALAR